MSLGELLGGLFPELGRPLRADDSPESLHGWDSVKHAEIVVSVEEAYGVDLSTREIQAIRSVGELARILGARGLKIEI